MANFLESYWIKQKTTSDMSDKKKVNLFDFTNVKKPSELMAQKQTKPTQSGFSNVPKTNQIRYNDIDLENAQKLKDLWVPQDKIIELVNKKKQQREWVQEQPKQEQWFFESVRYKPYTQEEVTAFDPNKSTAQNLIEWQGRYIKNTAWWLYNILPWIAQLWTWLVKWVWIDMYNKVGSLFWIDITEYTKWQTEKTNQLLTWIVTHYKDTYWSTEWLNKAIIEDPTAVISDALTVLWVWLAWKSKLNSIQKTALETEKANIINQVKNATTLEQKSALIKQWIEKSKQIVEKTKQVDYATAWAKTAFKYDPYVAVPSLAIKWTILWANKSAQVLNKVLQKTWDILPDRQKIAQNVSTKANRFNSVDEEEFIKEIWETPWEFAVTRWMSDVWEPAVEKATKNYLDSVKQADDAFEQIWWNYKYTWKGNDPIKISLDDLEKRYINTENDNLWRIQELKTKYETEWLTMPEINEVKRDYSRNFKYWFEDRNSEALARSSNIQNKLREWQFEKASEMGLENIRDINKNTKAWKMYADSLEKKINRSWANNAVSITDWIALSWWDVSNVALFLGKKLWTSNKAKQLLIKTLWKTTKSPIIKPNVNKPQIKWLLWQWPIITPAPKWKSNIKVTPSTIQPNVNRWLLALPEWKKPAIITPQTAEKWVIIESKLPLKSKTNGTNNNLPNNRNNSVMATKLKPSPQIETKLKNLTTSNIDDVARSFTSDAQKLAKIKVVIREHLKNKTSKSDLIEKIENILKSKK